MRTLDLSLRESHVTLWVGNVWKSAQWFSKTTPTVEHEPGIKSDLVGLIGEAATVHTPGLLIGDRTQALAL